ncbi:hypothetical protein, partial [Acinetobacter baumannii]|uniref:hypothetical protein n=1 Tax=Acinetobacter baumannii TaxID=470 RepID=UPI00339B36DF
RPLKFLLFWVKVVKVEAMDAKQSTNLLLYPNKPKKILMSIGVNGLGQLLTASILLGSTSTPSL